MSRETQPGSSHRRLLPVSLLAIPAALWIGFLVGSGETPHARAARPEETGSSALPQAASPEVGPRGQDAVGQMPLATIARDAATDGAHVLEPGDPAALRERLLQLEQRPDPGSAEELLRIREQLPGALAEDYARAAAAQAVRLAAEPGATEAAARLAEAAVETMARRLASGQAAGGDAWRAARVVLERLEWLGPEIPADLREPVEAIRGALEGGLTREAGRPTEAAAEAMALAEVVGGENIARVSFEFARASEDHGPPRTREALLVRTHAVRAAMRHGDADLRAEARAWLEQRLARAGTREEQIRLRELLDAALAR